jgi:hypothetical protein
VTIDGVQPVNLAAIECCPRVVNLLQNPAGDPDENPGVRLRFFGFEDNTKLLESKFMREV